MKHVFWPCLLFVLACLLLGFCLVPWWEKRQWKNYAEAVREGMPLEEVVRNLGPGQRSAKSQFQRTEKNEGITDYYIWQPGATFLLEVGVQDGKVKTVHRWYLGL